MKTKLCKLAEKYFVDKCPKYNHDYTPKYDELLRDKNIKSMLEIGIGYPEMMKKFTHNNYQSGASLFMWRDYFDCQVNGADIRDFNINSSNINIHKCDQSKSQSLIDMMNTIGEVDFIIDDGSHILEHQILTFITISRFCNKIYIIEDVDYKNFEKLSKLTNDTMICTLTYLPNKCRDNQGFVVFERKTKPNFDIPILYINLDSRTDRRKHMERLLDGYNYERVPAVYDEHGYIGCAKSHIKCMEIVAERGYDRCIILEDDFVFVDDNNFNTIKIPDFDFDILLICNHIKKYKIIDKDFNRVEWATWTSGYMVNKTIVEDLRYNLIEGMERLTESYKNKGELYNIKTVGRKNKTVTTLNNDIRKYYLDWYWNELFDKYMAVGLNNTIASQLNDYSDIQNRVENRYLVNKSVD